MATQRMLRTDLSTFEGHCAIRHPLPLSWREGSKPRFEKGSSAFFEALKSACVLVNTRKQVTRVDVLGFPVGESLASRDFDGYAEAWGEGGRGKERTIVVGVREDPQERYYLRVLRVSDAGKLECVEKKRIDGSNEITSIGVSRCGRAFTVTRAYLETKIYVESSCGKWKTSSTTVRVRGTKAACPSKGAAEVFVGTVRGAVASFCVETAEEKWSTSVGGEVRELVDRRDGAVEAVWEGGIGLLKDGKSRRTGDAWTRGVKGMSGDESERCWVRREEVIVAGVRARERSCTLPVRLLSS